jgi:hypothetical protein
MDSSSFLGTPCIKNQQNKNLLFIVYVTPVPCYQYLFKNALYIHIRCIYMRKIIYIHRLLNALEYSFVTRACKIVARRQKGR